MNSKQRILIMEILAFLALFSIQALGVSIGISPGKLEFINVLQGGYAEGEVTISTNEAYNISVNILPGGDLGRWMRLEPNESSTIISPGKPKKIKVVVEPSKDARLTSYKGNVLFVADAAGNISGRAGGFVKSSVVLLVEMNTSGTEHIDCNGGAFYITDIEFNNPLEIGYTFKNSGNVRMQPALSAEIWDITKERILLSKEFIAPSEVLPTTEQDISFTFNHDLTLGDYRATFSLPECNVESSAKFSVLEQGSIADKGILESISAKTWATTEEVIPITAVFQNLGPGPVLARLKGEISSEGSVVEAFDTEALEVGTQQKATFQHYFTPHLEGRYVLKGKVFYNNKLTDEKGTIINVQEAEQEKGNDFNLAVLLVYLIIFLAIFFLVRKVVRGRKKRR